jgi:hypothetical protein
MDEGILQEFVKAGANVESSNCGPCFGSHMGVLAGKSKMISSSNRNYQGRMGSGNAQVFLGSPATVVASAIEGRLTWDDGDTTERELHVPILADTVTELPEDFLVTLSDVQGGVGLGTSAASIFIAADGDPFGQFNIRTDTERVYEPGQGARVIVSRDYYRTGAVSVTLTPVSGTATAGADFSADPVTLSWADGDNQAWFVDFAILDDSIAEQDETFTVQLSDPTGGAFIGPNSVAEFVIWANDAPSTKSKKGGGALGYLSLLLLGFMVLFRPARRPAQSASTATIGVSNRAGFNE